MTNPLTAKALTADPRANTKALADTALDALSIELVECRKGLVTARMPAPTGNYGRSALLVLAETAVSTAAGMTAKNTQRAFGTELNCTMLQEFKEGDTAVIAATPLMIDSALHCWQIEIKNQRGDLILKGRCTLSIVDV